MKHSAKTKIKDSIEGLLHNVSRAKFVPDYDHSMSLIAAKEAVGIFTLVVKSAPKESSADTVIKTVIGVGRLLQRATAFRLLLTNVTRRVLYIIRDAERASLMTEEEMRRRFGCDGAMDDADSEEEGGAGGGDLYSPLTAAPPALKGTKAGGGGFAQAAFPSADFQTPATSEMFEWGESTSPPTIEGQTLTRVKSSLNIGAGGGGGGGNLDDLDDVSTQGGADHSTDNVATPDDESPTPSLRIQSLHFPTFQDTVLAGLEELEDDYSAMTEALSSRAPDHIHDGEVILTYGCSHSMLRFFESAAKRGHKDDDDPPSGASRTRFHIIALDGEPHASTDKLQAALADCPNVTMQRFPDSSCFAVMSRVSKVFLSTEAVLANGGLLATIGTHSVVLTARHFSVPVVVVAMTPKLCPYYPSDQICSSLVKMSRTEAKEMLWSTFGNPAEILGPEFRRDVSDPTTDEVQVFSPATEYVPHDHIALFVTNDGEFTTAGIHRFVTDQYNEEDTHI